MAGCPEGLPTECWHDVMNNRKICRLCKLQRGKAPPRLDTEAYSTDTTLRREAHGQADGHKWSWGCACEGAESGTYWYGRDMRHRCSHSRLLGLLS